MTKRKNILQKFQTFLNRQTPEDIKNLHTLMAAWRGPDTEDSELKTKYTAKIRATMIGENLVQNCKAQTFLNEGLKYYMSEYGGFEVNNEPLTEDDREQIWKELVKNNSHYACHTGEAIKLLLKLQE